MMFEEELFSTNIETHQFIIEIIGDRITFTLNNVKLYIYTLKLNYIDDIELGTDKNSFFRENISKLLQGVIIGEIPIELINLYASELCESEDDFSFVNPKKPISDDFVRLIQNKYGLEFASFVNKINKFDRPDLVFKEITEDKFLPEDSTYNTLCFICDIYMRSRLKI